MNELKIFGFKESLYQWDTNQKLVIPYYRPNMEFHFANKVTISKGRSAIVMYPYEQKPDFWVVDVPDVILQEPYNLVVYQCDDDDTKTEYRIKVTPRPKPDDYVYTETEVLKYSQLEERVEKLEEQMENGGGGGGTGASFEVDGTTLKLENGVLSVNTINEVKKDNTQPITSAAVETVVGNINVLLETI